MQQYSNVAESQCSKNVQLRLHSSCILGGALLSLMTIIMMVMMVMVMILHSLLDDNDDDGYDGDGDGDSDDTPFSP